MKELYELKGEGHSIRGIARELGISRNSVRKYLKSPGVPQAKPRPRRSSKLDPYAAYVDHRLSDGLENCVVLLRELRARGYEGGYTTLVEYVRPRRRRRQPKATVRFETAPGEQAQVDWGSFAYVAADGRRQRMWAFVMVLGWSRAIYVEFVRRADVSTFMGCHINAFEYFGGVPRRCLYDNAKVVVLGRDEDGRPEWNRRMLDLSLRTGFEMRLCRPYRPQTKGKVESGVKYVRRNLWPGVRFTDDADMNRQAWEWCDSVGQPAGAWDDTAAAAGAAGAGADALGAAAGAVPPDALPARGPEGGPRRLRALGRVPLRRALVVGGHDRPDGRGFRHGGDLARAATGWRCIPGPSGLASASPCRGSGMG